MDDFPDFEIRRPSDEPVAVLRHPAGSPGVWIVAALLVIAVAAAGYVVFRTPRSARPAAPAQSGAVRVGTAAVSLGGEPQPIPVPPLDRSDPLVRTLLGSLSTAPAIAAWLATDNLIRNFTVVVARVAEGATAGRQLQVLRPSASFQVVDRGGVLSVDPRSYERYSGIADAVASIDPAGAARLYATLKPRIGEAYGELGLAEPSFDRTLERAIVSLLDTPAVDGPVRLEQKGIGYRYADDRLENLSNAQKQLLRMGPRNVRVIEGRLREIALALGVPPNELPRQ